MIGRSRNRVGVVLLIAALVCWIGFHFLPIHESRRGWKLWEETWRVLTRWPLPEWKTMIAISAFLTTAVLLTASPFVIPLLRTSKPCRWLAIGASGAALLGLGSFILGKPAAGGPAWALILAAMTLNFIGLLCLRAPRLETGMDPS